MKNFNEEGANRKDEIIGFLIKLFQLQVICEDADYF